jgi:hypothetical protein
MNGWTIAGIVVAAVIVVAFVIEVPDLMRYLRIRRM